jgi:hypothetical protein
MISRPWSVILSLLVLTLAAAAGERAWAQFGVGGFSAGYPSAGAFGSGYVGNSYGGYGGFSAAGYGVRSGRIGPGYQSAGRLYQMGYQAARPQTTVAFQPLYNAITLVPGWYGPTHRARRRLHAQPSAPRTPPFDDNGQILWPSTIPNDSGAVALRRAADAAIRAVVHESKSTGHASVKPVIDAKNKLSAFERKVLPEVKAKNATDGAAIERFFVDLDNALDAMTYVY